MPHICVDASLVLLWLLPQQRNEAAESLWLQWRAHNVDLLAPPLLYAEVPSVLRENVFHKRITPEQGDVLFDGFCRFGIRAVHRPDLHVRAWELAKELNTPRVYDMHYVALAELERCEFYTADERLLRRIRVRRPWARGIGGV